MIAIRSLSSLDSLPVIENIFHLTLVYNQGVAFGFFREHPSFLFIFISLSLIVLFIWSHSLIRSMPSAKWPLGLILGGAVGNWIDRVRLGAVVDFLDFRVWPVFNFADSFITVGVVFYLILLMQKKDENPLDSSDTAS